MYLSRDILCICKQTHIAILFLLVTYVIACHTITRYFVCVCVCVCVGVGDEGRPLRDLSWCRDFKGMPTDSSVLASSRGGGKLPFP